MADDSGEKVLLEMGMDMTPMQKSTQALKDALSQLNSLSDQYTSKVGTQQAAAVAKVKAATDGLFQSTMKVAAAETAKDAALKAQIASLEKQLTMGKVAVEQAEKRLALTEATAKAEAGIGSKLAQSIGGGLFGSAGGMVAGVMTGVVGGEIAFKGIEEGLKKLKEIVVESGKLAEIQTSFDKAAKGKGVDPDAMIKRLRVVTEGEVGNLTLYKTALSGLSGPLNLSHQQIEQLIGDAEKLAKAHGKIPVEEAVLRVNQMLAMGTLSPRSMARAIGVSAPREIPLPSNLGPQARQTGMALQAVAAIHQMAEGIGELPATIEDVQTKMSVLFKNTAEGFGVGVNLSGGMQAFLRSIDEGIDGMGTMADKARSLGNVVGNYLGVIGIGLSGLIPVAKEVYETIAQIFAPPSTAIESKGVPTGPLAPGEHRQTPEDAFTELYPVLSKVVNSLIDFDEALALIAGTINILMGPLLKFAAMLGGEKELPPDYMAHYGETKAQKTARIFAATEPGMSSGEVTAPIQGGFKEGSKSFLGQISDLQEKLLERSGAAKLSAATGFTSHPSAASTPPPKAPSDVTLAQEKEKLEAAAKLQEEANKAALATQQQNIAKKKALNDNLFAVGLIDIREHSAQEKAENGALAQAELTELQKNYDAQQKVREFDLKNTTGAADKQKAELLALEAAKQKIVADNALKTLQIDQTSAEDTLKAIVTRKSSEIDTAKDANETLLKVDEDRYSRGVMSFTAYVKSRKDLIDANAKLEQDDLDNKFTLEKKGDDSQAVQDAKKKAVRDKQDQEQAQFDLTIPEIALKQLRLLALPPEQAQAILAQSKLPAQQRPAGTPTVPSALSNYLGALGTQKSGLEDVQSTVNRTQDPERWYNLQKAILQVNEEIAKTSFELQQLAKDLAELSSIGAAVAAVAGIGGGRIGGATGKQVISALGSAGGIFQSIHSPTGLINDIADYQKESAAASVPVVYGAGSGNEQGQGASSGTAGASAQAMQAFTKGVISAAQALTSFVSTVMESKSAAGGALSGGMSGASVGSAFGPIGMAIGAAAGAAFGAIIGSKNAEVTWQINDAKTSFQNIMNQFSQNTNSLQNTISQITQVVAQLEIEQASSKKGSSQYQALIDQYNQELVQLTTQQQQVIRNMQQQVAILSQPVGQAQSALTSLQGIMNQYMQMAGAAQNQAQLDTANQFLSLSLEQQRLSVETELLQSNQQAIQDALQLNDLLFQQQQDLLNYNQQVQGILSAGVLTRTQTRAQTVGQQIYQAQLQFTRSQQDLDAQIATEQFKVDAEEQIFNLATTRIGLENQLVSVQDAQTTLQMAQVASLSSLYSQLTSGTVDPNSPLGQLLAAIQAVNTILGTQTGLGAYLGLTPSNANGLTGPALTIGQEVTPQGGLGSDAWDGGASAYGADVLDALVRSAYNNRASQGYASFRGANL